MENSTETLELVTLITTEELEANESLVVLCYRFYKELLDPAENSFCEELTDFLAALASPRSLEFVYLSGEILPDICGNCLTILGETLEGRIRDQCPNCSIGTLPIYKSKILLGRLQAFFRNDSPEVERFIIKTLGKYNILRKE